MVHVSAVAGLKILQLLCLDSHVLNVTSDLLSSCGITSDSNSYSFHDCLDGLWRQGVCIAHSMHTGFWTVLGDVPQLVTVLTGPTGGIESPPLLINIKSLILPLNPIPV